MIVTARAAQLELDDTVNKDYGNLERSKIKLECFEHFSTASAVRRWPVQNVIRKNIQRNIERKRVLFLTGPTQNCVDWSCP